MSSSSVTTIPWSCGFISHPSHHPVETSVIIPPLEKSHVTFNQTSKNRRHYSFYQDSRRDFFGRGWEEGEKRKMSRRSYVYLPWSLALVKSGMTYEMTRVPTPTEFRICGRWRMLRRGITENNPSEVFPSVQVHVGGVLQLDRYTLLEFDCLLFHGFDGIVIWPIHDPLCIQFLARFWRRVDVYCYTILLTRWQLCLRIMALTMI